jgi:hypothetical protein
LLVTDERQSLVARFDQQVHGEPVARAAGIGVDVLDPASERGAHLPGVCVRRDSQQSPAIHSWHDHARPRLRKPY